MPKAYFLTDHGESYYDPANPDSEMSIANAAFADLLTEIETGGKSTIREGGNLKLGVTTLPNLPKDTSDRNRTSPFAFTGKKFEFRMVGSSMSIADCNVMINTIVAEAPNSIWPLALMVPRV